MHILPEVVKLHSLLKNIYSFQQFRVCYHILIYNFSGGFIMKKLFAAVAFIIAAVLAVPPVAAAEIPDETLGVYSVITDKDGSE